MMLSLRSLKYLSFMLLLNTFSFSLFANTNYLLAKELCELTHVDAISTQVSQNASARLIRLISQQSAPLDSKAIYETQKQKQIEALAKQYTAVQLKNLINTYQNPLMNRFLKEYQKLVLIESTSLLPLYIFQENVKILKNNAPLPHDQKAQYLKLTRLSSAQLHAKSFAPILESAYYKTLIYSDNENIRPESTTLINLISKHVYQKDKVTLAKNNFQEIFSLMTKHFNFSKNDENEIKNIVNMSTDDFYFERNLEKEFSANDIKEVQKILSSDSANLDFLTLPLKIAALMNNTLRASAPLNGEKDEHHFVMAVAGPIFKYTHPE